MPSSTHPADPPYRRIAAEFRTRIRAGELRPGARMPSIRQIARRWGVAIATATRVMAVLREEGLVEPTVGSGTVVSASVGRGPQAHAAAPRGPRLAQAPRQDLNRAQVLRAAVAVADAEGLAAVTMRRLAAELGVGPMSLYRHVTGKDELVTQMADAVMGEVALPAPGPDGWRAKLELLARRQWELGRRHPWLPRAVSVTRPLLAPNAMEQTERVLRALDGLGLPMEVRIREALALHALVLTVALSLAEELDAEQETGVTFDRWWSTRRDRVEELLDGGRFPLLAAIPQEVVSDLDGMFEYSLARHLDGFAALVAAHRPPDG